MFLYSCKGRQRKVIEAQVYLRISETSTKSTRSRLGVPDRSIKGVRPRAYLLRLVTMWKADMNVYSRLHVGYNILNTRLTRSLSMFTTKNVPRINYSQLLQISTFLVISTFLS